MIFSKNASLLMKYLFLCALTLPWQCMALHTIERWGDNDNVPSFRTRRILSDVDDTSDKATFFIVFSIGLLIIAVLATYSCKQGCCVDNCDVDSGAVVHPPPQHLRNFPQAHPPPVNSNFSYTNAGYTSPPPPGIYASAPPPGMQSSAPPLSHVDGPGDMPPDYATVVLTDLNTGNLRPTFPEVNKTEMPPPKFEDQH